MEGRSDFQKNSLIIGLFFVFLILLSTSLYLNYIYQQNDIDVDNIQINNKNNLSLNQEDKLKTSKTSSTDFIDSKLDSNEIVYHNIDLVEEKDGYVVDNIINRKIFKLNKDYQYTIKNGVLIVYDKDTNLDSDIHQAVYILNIFTNPQEKKLKDWLKEYNDKYGLFYFDLARTIMTPNNHEVIRVEEEGDPPSVNFYFRINEKYIGKISTIRHRLLDKMLDFVDQIK